MFSTMRIPTLFRRRSVPLPTVAGCLGISLVLVLAGLFAAREIHPFLAPTEPVGARVLVVEGWIPDEEIDQVVARVRAGSYERVVTTGGPIAKSFATGEIASYAELSKRLLEERGVAKDAIVAVPAPQSAQDRTFLSAVVVRDWMRARGEIPASLDLFSSGAHSRRSWRLFRLAFGPAVRVGVLAARPRAYDPDAWWRTSLGTKTVLTEAIGWAWTAIFFHPGTPGSDAERWGNPARGRS
jgi:hypothetical protein